jgi:hypothetical protein
MSIAREYYCIFGLPIDKMTCDLKEDIDKLFLWHTNEILNKHNTN